MRLWSPAAGGGPRIATCVRCGLGRDVPGRTFDGDGLCKLPAYDSMAPQAEAWFRTERDLADRLAEPAADDAVTIDAVHLLSGGKDSTYALYQLVEMGFEVLALTLDNGFISEGAKENIRRTVADLGVAHEVRRHPST